MTTGITWPLADIPPPPPELPLIDATLPQPVVIVIGGLCLAAVVWMLGTRLVKPGSGGCWPKFVAIGIVALTVPAAIWSNQQYREHRKQRSNWRSPGPVRPPTSATEQFGDVDPFTERGVPHSSERGVPHSEAVAEPPTDGDTR